jgi:hypothetical protein
MISFFARHFVELAAAGATIFGVTLLSVSIIENMRAR